MIDDEASEAALDRDVVLMKCVAAGDTGAFRELIEAHQMRIVGTVAKMLGDSADAEDIAQQVFIRVWKSASRYQPTAKFTTWLFRIMRNLVLNELRRRQRHPLIPLERDSDERHFEAPDKVGSTPAQSLLEAELQAAIQSAIDDLPEAQRMAVILRRYEEMSYEEIGEVLDLSVPAVKSVLFRARTELRARLENYLHE